MKNGRSKNTTPDQINGQSNWTNSSDQAVQYAIGGLSKYMLHIPYTM